MIFQLPRRMGALFASMALMGSPLGGSNTWAVSADLLTCDIVFDYFTWEDKTLPMKQVPVPGNKVLKYGIGHVLAERFDINAGRDNFMTSNKFQSYEIKAADPDPDRWQELLSEHPLDGEGFELEEEDEEPPLGEETTSSSSNLRRSLRRKIPRGCYRNYHCISSYYKLFSSRHLQNGRLDIGFCNLCAEDDDYDPRRIPPHLEFALPQEFTLDQLLALSSSGSHGSYGSYNATAAAAADSDSDDGRRSLHQGFERDVCTEIQNLEDDFPSFRRTQGCKIIFRCHHLQESDSDGDSDLVIVDHRQNHQGDELHDYDANANANGNGNGNVNGDDTRGLLYSITNKLSSKESDQKDDEALYSVTAAAP